VVIASGAKQQRFIALVTLLNPGDEVMSACAFLGKLLRNLSRWQEGVPIIVDASESLGFKLTPDQLAKAITDRDKG
jgi:aspartate aminotransferase